jgi:hypothetical protein
MLVSYPWYETQNSELIALVRRNARTEKEFGALLHHVVSCDECRDTARKLYKTLDKGVKT